MDAKLTVKFRKIIYGNVNRITAGGTQELTIDCMYKILHCTLIDCLREVERPLVRDEVGFLSKQIKGLLMYSYDEIISKSYLDLPATILRVQDQLMFGKGEYVDPSAMCDYLVRSYARNSDLLKLVHELVMQTCREDRVVLKTLINSTLDYEPRLDDYLPDECYPRYFKLVEGKFEETSLHILEALARSNDGEKVVYFKQYKRYGHLIEKHFNCENPYVCNVCNGLDWCGVCKQGESELTTECSGGHAVGAGLLDSTDALYERMDFRFGKWIPDTAKYCGLIDRYDSIKTYLPKVVSCGHRLGGQHLEDALCYIKELSAALDKVNNNRRPVTDCSPSILNVDLDGVWSMYKLTDAGKCRIESKRGALTVVESGMSKTELSEHMCALATMLLNTKESITVLSKDDDVDCIKIILDKIIDRNGAIILTLSTSEDCDFIQRLLDNNPNLLDTLEVYCISYGNMWQELCRVDCNVYS